MKDEVDGVKVCAAASQAGSHVPAQLPEAHVLEVRIAACEPVWGSTNGKMIVSGRVFEETGKHLDG